MTNLSIRLLLLNEFTFVYFHTEKYGVLHLAEEQMGENCLWNNFGVDINLHQFLNFSARTRQFYRNIQMLKSGSLLIHYS